MTLKHWNLSHARTLLAANAVATVEDAQLNDRRIVTVILHTDIPMDELVDGLHTKNRAELLAKLCGRSEVLDASVFRDLSGVKAFASEAFQSPYDSSSPTAAGAESERQEGDQ